MVKNSENSIARTSFFFPPDKMDIPQSEFKKIILDLPQLSISAWLKYHKEDDDNFFRFELRNKEPYSNELSAKLVREYHQPLTTRQS